jgi:hypothetical protein
MVFKFHTQEIDMIADRTRMVAGTFTRSALSLGILIAFATEAGAGNASVNSACANDYLAYCSQHDPDGPGVRRCMRAVGRKLSMGCVNALIEAGEVSKNEVARRARASK